jgi:drug/metabolite transporter (DMT)-like permease
MAPHPHTAHTINAFEWLLLVALSVLWGGSFFFNGIAVRELPTFTVVVVRVALAAVILLLVMRATRQALPAGAHIWRAFIVMGVLNNAIPFGLIVWGQQHIASGLAAILNATTPLFTVFVVHFVAVDERMSGRRLGGVVLGVIGVVVLVGPGWLYSADTHVGGQLAILGAALSYGFASLYGRRFASLGVTPMASATGQVCGSSLVLLPIMLFVDRPWLLSMPSTETLLALFGLASLSTALAYILYFRILATAGATNLMLVTLLLPVTAMVLGIAFLNETLRTQDLVGMIIIGFGLVVLDGRLALAIRARIQSAK